jgi:hypothetical protein
MRSHRSFSALLVLATIACSDTPVSPFRGSVSLPEPEDGFRTVTGIVVSETELRDYADGSTILLEGPQTRMLGELLGAEIRILGTADEFAGARLWVIEFRVLAVDGIPALDGMLGYDDEGFAIVSAEGAYTSLAEIPEDLMTRLGKRVWLTLRDGAWVRYGVIEE